MRTYCLSQHASYGCQHHGACYRLHYPRVVLRDPRGTLLSFSLEKRSAA